MDQKNENLVDYSHCTIDEIKDVIANIDAEQFPKRYQQAKTMLSIKLAEQENKLSRDAVERAAETNASKSKPTKKVQQPEWSEQHLLTRIVIASLMFLILSLIPNFIFNFMVTTTWTESTIAWVAILATSLLLMWIIGLVKDEKFKAYMLANWRGKLGLVATPFLFVLLSSELIDKTIPTAMHFLSAQQEATYEMKYRKRNRIKFCRFRLEIVEQDNLTSSDLCISKEQRNRLPETGKIGIIGSQSQFGMMIKDYRLL